MSMKKSYNRKFLFSGFVLFITSTCISALTFRSYPNENFNGIQADSTGLDGNQVTCINQAGSMYNCHYTAATVTTPTGLHTSWPNSGSSTDGSFRHSSQSPI